MPRLASVTPGQLKLDLVNPRIPDATFLTEDEALRYLYAQADLGELIQSIGNSGWLDFEPLKAGEASRRLRDGGVPFRRPDTRQWGLSYAPTVPR